MVKLELKILELNLARDMEGDVDGFCRFIGSKRKMRGSTGLLLNGAGDL